MKKAALISVTDKKGIVEFARELVALNYVILSSSGTASALKDAGIPVTLVEDYTGQNEILDGRVKTLHPKIHSGILAKRSDTKHMAELSRNEIWPIDIVVVNLYPFLEKVKGPDGKDPSAMVNFIDVGGPSMLRGAAKNHEGVLAIVDPDDYERVIAELKKGEVSLSIRQGLAAKVFMTLANYDLEIARYFGSAAESIGPTPGHETSQLGLVGGMVLLRAQELRYGENPHQRANLYFDLNHFGRKRSWVQLHGKALSYNNLLDFDATLRMIRDLADKPTAAIFKHLNPCGVGRSEDLREALKLAKRGDPRSHFGGIVGFTRSVGADVAEELTDGFVEVVIAPAFDESAKEILFKRKNLRVIEVNLDAPTPEIEIRNIQDGVLLQERDNRISSVREGRVVSKRQPTEEEVSALQFAWTVCSHVKSNAIVATSDSMILSVGAGQMSRVDAAELLIARAKLHGNSLSGGVAASDAFFPFPDSVEELIKSGISFLVAPGGATRDEEVVSAVDRLGGGLIFVEDRHFRH